MKIKPYTRRHAVSMHQTAASALKVFLGGNKCFNALNEHVISFQLPHPGTSFNFAYAGFQCTRPRLIHRNCGETLT